MPIPCLLRKTRDAHKTLAACICFVSEIIENIWKNILAYSELKFGDVSF